MNASKAATAPAIGAITAPLDLRLGVGAVAAWLAVALTIGRPPVIALSIAVGAALVGVAVCVVTRRFGHATALAAAAFCVALVLLPLAARLAWARDGPLAHLATSHADVVADLRVASDPRPLSGRGSVSAAPRIAVDADLKAVRIAGRKVAIGGHLVVFAPASSWRELIPGQVVRSQVRLAPADGSRTAVRHRGGAIRSRADRPGTVVAAQRPLLCARRCGKRRAPFRHPPGVCCPASSTAIPVNSTRCSPSISGRPG